MADQVGDDNRDTIKTWNRIQAIVRSVRSRIHCARTATSRGRRTIVLSVVEASTSNLPVLPSTNRARAKPDRVEWSSERADHLPLLRSSVPKKRDTLIGRCSESSSLVGDLCLSSTLDVRNPPVQRLDEFLQRTQLIRDGIRDRS